METWESKRGEERTVLTPYFKHTYPLGIGNAVLSGVPGVLEDFSGGTGFVFLPLQSVDKE